MKQAILGVNFTPSTLHKAVQYVIVRREQLAGQYLCFSNVHTTVMAADDAAYRKILNHAARTFADGAPIAFLLRRGGQKDTERVAGPAFMEEMFRATADGSLSHYFYGSTPEVLEALTTRLKREYPALRIAGSYSPPFTDAAGTTAANTASTTTDSAQGDPDIARINAAQPDILWVGLGAPKQEKWMYAHKGEIQAVMAGVGAAFDFSAGSKKRAPEWMQKCGLEWLYRLILEPKRLWRRYLVTNTKFLWYVLTGR